MGGWFAGDLTEEEFDRVVALDNEGDAAARRFLRWLCGEVLPAIESGGYRERWPGEAEAEITRIIARVRPH